MNTSIPENFTLALALFDLLPVILFSISSVLVAIRFKNPIFNMGISLCILAGLGKVVWKILVATAQINIPFFFYEFRVTMPLGFILVIFSFAIVKKTIVWGDVFYRLVAPPAGIFFGITILGLIGMIVIKLVLDMTDSRANWIAEITNTVAQASLLAGLITMKKRFRDHTLDESDFI